MTEAIQSRGGEFWIGGLCYFLLYITLILHNTAPGKKEGGASVSPFLRFSVSPLIRVRGGGQIPFTPSAQSLAKAA